MTRVAVHQRDAGAEAAAEAPLPAAPQGRRQLLSAAAGAALLAAAALQAPDAQAVIKVSRAVRALGRAKDGVVGP